MATRPSMLPETLLPRISVTRWRREGIPAMAATLAAALRVPAIMGRRETADICGGSRCVLWDLLGGEKGRIKGKKSCLGLGNDRHGV
jgi:hypothetical protein